ncbi:hypothetical protein MCOR02_003653 [Pyricularia oryzae]|nr:hypothetical protein MCOR02_003653 [Pyricularia oryzae]KAI6495120.1 hypothetical protein MCOR13_007333 [Pyricularia oryzae]
MADVLAILPLLLSAIRGAYLLTNTIKGMKNHKKLRRRIQRVVDCQTMRFTNQLYRMFRDSKCDGIILLTRVEDLFEQERNMLPEEESGVEIAIRGHFRERQDELHHIFKTFIEVANQANQTLENISKRNLSMPVHFVWERSGLQELVDEMKELNDYLGEMIETAKLSMPGNSNNPMSAPPSYQESTACLGLRQSAATLAKKLEDARSNTMAILSMLQTTPTCADPRHSGDSTHSLHLLIRCLPPRQGEPRIAALLRYFTNVDCLHSSTVASFEIVRKLCVPNPPSPQIPLVRVESGPRPPSPPDSQMGAEERLAKALEASVTEDPATPAAEVDICQQASSPGEKQIRNEGLWSLAINPTVDFTFEDAEFPASPKRLRLYGSNMSLAGLLRFPKYEVVGDHHRIELALLLSRALLKFYNTQCWPRGCLLSHVKFYTGSDDRDADGIDLDACLDTLHISANPVREQPLNSSDDNYFGDFPSGLSDEQTRKVRDKLGIENLELYCLGVAILQIGLWKRIPWDDVERVRRKARNLNYMGNAYYGLTKRLIDCTFEPPATLSMEKLRISLVKHVVKELEALLRIVKSKHWDLVSILMPSVLEKVLIPRQYGIRVAISTEKRQAVDNVNNVRVRPSRLLRVRQDLTKSQALVGEIVVDLSDAASDLLRVFSIHREFGVPEAKHEFETYRLCIPTNCLFEKGMT